MIKKITAIVFGLVFIISIASCTSKESKDDVEVASGSEDEISLDGEEAKDLTSDQLPEDALGGAPSDAPPPAETPPSDSLAVENPPPSSEPPPPDFAATEKPADTLSSMPPPEEKTETPAPEPVAKKPASLQKIPEKPWKQSGMLLNAVYFARPNDTIESISQMIYGSDKTEDLKKANAQLRKREPKPSEKIFYNSPIRPSDEDRLLTYYEDMGMQPETYTAQSGDNIVKVSKDLLGYDNAWKEIWPINPVESKGALDEGTQLRYWKGPAAQAAAPTPPPPPPMPEPTEAAPPPTNVAGNTAEMPPPPPPDMPPPSEVPPPPPPLEAAPPPPPPPPMAEEPPPPPPKRPKSVEGETMDSDTTIALAVIAVAAAGLGGLLVVRKRRRQKEMERAFGDTQVGT